MLPSYLVVQELDFVKSGNLDHYMKNSQAYFDEWWEVAEEYFTKELEKNLA